VSEVGGFEIVQVETLEGDGALEADADIVVDHEGREHGAVDEDDAHVAEAADVVDRVAGEAGGGDEDALVGRLAVQGADEGLDRGATDGVVGGETLGLEVSRKI
jgi:hypothetical protein